MPELVVFQIGSEKIRYNYRFIIAPRDQEEAIAASLPAGEFIDSYSTLSGVLGGDATLWLGNDLLNQFICDAIEEPSAWQVDTLQRTFTETLGKEKQNA